MHPERVPTEQTPIQLAGARKVAEYVTRIQQGQESRERIIDGLPPAFVRAIDSALGDEPEREVEQVNVETREVLPHALVQVPSQYEGIPPEILDEIWTIPEYIDPEKTRTEQARKRAVIAMLEEQERAASIVTEQTTQDAEQLEEIRLRLRAASGFEKKGTPTVSKTEQIQDPFGTFRVKHGETDTGMFWYEYRNIRAKELKESGQLEWGKERIYFDVPLIKLEQLRDIVMRVARDAQVPVAFKHLDVAQSLPSAMDGKETRFVANFATQEDAIRFYQALSFDEMYKTIQSDRNISYGGYRVSSLAEYANGYRESREALTRIVQEGAFNDQGRWQWNAPGGRIMSIDSTEYQALKQQYDTLTAKVADAERTWQRALTRG